MGPSPRVEDDAAGDRCAFFRRSPDGRVAYLGTAPGRSARAHRLGDSPRGSAAPVLGLVARPGACRVAGGAPDRSPPRAGGELGGQAAAYPAGDPRCTTAA